MLRQLAPKYIDTGKVKVVYRHLAQIGPESEWAAQASECANDQNWFWDYIEYAYSKQTGENVGGYTRDNLKKFAAELGLDTTAFNACLDSNKYENFVRQETEEGRRRGVRATPSFFVNGQFIEGLPTAAQFSNMLDAMAPK